MMFRILKPSKEQNPMEVVRISFFSPSYETHSASDQVVSELDVVIPLDAGSYASAAMVLGYRDNFLSKVITPDQYDDATKELFEMAEKILKEFKEQNRKIILK